MTTYIHIVWSLFWTSIWLPLIILAVKFYRWKKRAEFAELYAAQLERELEIPPCDRIDKDSWMKSEDLT